MRRHVPKHLKLGLNRAGAASIKTDFRFPQIATSTSYKPVQYTDLFSIALRFTTTAPRSARNKSLMVRSSLVLLVAVSAVSVRGLFSVHDDILAFPQYEIQFPQDPISEAEAEARLAQAPTSSSFSASPTSTDDDENDGVEKAEESYETLWLNDNRYLCSVPVVKPPPTLNATEKELSRAAEEKELARATTRGWELLSELEGECLYFVSGWWSYSYCHNREVRQFHQKAPQSGVAIAWPPTEDPGTPSYVLGQVNAEKRAKTEKQRGEGNPVKGEGTELQATGELRYLVQKLGGGTTCDLTRKERKIEIQFHCNSGSTDRIGWIKEISICCYLMVVYTPRLCDDVAFLPPREDRANGVQCRRIMDPEAMAEFYTHKAKAEQADALEMLRKAAITALGLEGLGVGEAVAVGQGKKGGKIEVGENKDKKTDKKLDQIVFVEVSGFDDDIRDEEPEEEEEEWLHQEL